MAGSTDLSQFKWAVIGDSISDPGHPSPANAVVKYYHYISADTGIQVVYTNAVGGTGYKKTNGGSQCFYKRLETSPIPSDVDVVTIFGSINDWSLVTGGDVGSPTDDIATSDSLSAHMNAAIDLVRSQAPDAKLILVSGIYGNIAAHTVTNEAGRFGMAFRVNDSTGRQAGNYAYGGVWVADSGTGSPVDGGQNFTISGSPAIDAGTSYDGIVEDLDNARRKRVPAAGLRVPRHSHDVLAALGRILSCTLCLTPA